MAAALFMMNMHGAVCASDRDRTIFRYSDKIPFAIMVDPTSELPWEDIMMTYQARKSLSSENTLEKNAEDFRVYLTDVLSQKDEVTQDRELGKKIICVGYDPNNMFPNVTILRIDRYKNGIIIFKSDNKIREKRPERPGLQEYHLHLGNCPNIQILFGGMSEDVLKNTEVFFRKKIGEIMGNEEDANGLINNFKTEYLTAISHMQNDPHVINSISGFTIKDMVSMAENLIETEGLQDSNGTSISPVREIGVVTLAEGFVWIKHSLYGV